MAFLLRERNKTWIWLPIVKKLFPSDNKTRLKFYLKSCNFCIYHDLSVKTNAQYSTKCYGKTCIFEFDKIIFSSRLKIITMKSHSKDFFILCCHAICIIFINQYNSSLIFIIQQRLTLTNHLIWGISQNYFVQSTIGILYVHF